MGAYLLQADLHAGHESFVDFGAVADLGKVAGRSGQHVEEPGLEDLARLAEEPSGKLKNASRVGDHLDRLDSGDLIEEPAAAGVHQLGVALQLHQLERGGALGLRELMGGVRVEKGVDVWARTVEDDADIGVASRPEVFEQLFRQLFGQGNRRVPKLIEAHAQGCSPLLVPSRASAVASAIGTPALDTMSTAPGGIVDDLGLPARRILCEKRRIVNELDLLFVFEPVDCVRESHLSVSVVMAVTFAVRRHIGQRGLAVDDLGAIAKSGNKSLSKIDATIKQALEGDGAGIGPVVEEDRNGPALVELDPVRMAGVYGGVRGLGPGSAFERTLGLSRIDCVL